MLSYDIIITNCRSDSSESRDNNEVCRGGFCKWPIDVLILIKLPLFFLSFFDKYKNNLTKNFLLGPN